MARLRRRRKQRNDAFAEYLTARAATLDDAEIKKNTEKWTRTRGDELAVQNGCWFDSVAADCAVMFFENFLRHSKGEWAGQPFELMPWQADDIIRPLFGWKNAEGYRRHRMAYIEIPKKNGKSTMSSGLALLLLCGDGEPGAEVYCAAADRQQASIVYREARDMVRTSPELAPRLRVTDSKKEITHAESNSLLRVLSAEAYTAEGLNIHGLIFDELHAQKTRELWDALRYGGAARRQPLLVSITTAGWDTNSICYEQHQYATRCTDPDDPLFDDSFFAYIAAADKEADWKSIDTAAKANPSFGVTLRADDFESAIKEASESPRKENGYKRYRLNIWTEQADRWLPIDRWDESGAGIPDIEDGASCYVGLDLSSTTDITAAVFLFPVDGGYVVRPRFYIPEYGARQRGDRDRVPYQQWAKDGFVTMTPGEVIDYEYIRNDLNEAGKIYDIEEVAIDRWNATQLATQLDGDGFVIAPYGQGFRDMSAPSKELEGLILSRRIRHDNNPVLRWMAGNVAVEEDAAGNLKPSKKVSTERIDGIVALIMALGRAMLRDEDSDCGIMIL